MAHVATAQLRRSLRIVTARLGGPPKAAISAWFLHPVLAALGADVSVYWAQDDFVGGAPLFGLSQRLIERSEPQVAAEADLVVAANPLVAERWLGRGHRVELVPFGCDIDHFTFASRLPRPPELQGLPDPLVGMVGQLNGRTDLRFLEAVAERGVSLVLVGPVDPTFEPPRLAALLARSNVLWVGPKPFEELPAWVGSFQVGLVPYNSSPFNLGSFPLKTLEYLAAGCRVVATPLPAHEWLNSDHLVIEPDPARFADAVLDALEKPLGDSERDSRQRLAAEHSWESRTATILRHIETTARLQKA